MITAAYATKSTERGKCMNLVTDHEFIVSKWPKNTGYRSKKILESSNYWQIKRILLIVIIKDECKYRYIIKHNKLHTMKSRRKKIGVESVMTAPLYLDTRKL